MPETEERHQDESQIKFKFLYTKHFVFFCKYFSSISSRLTKTKIRTSKNAKNTQSVQNNIEEDQQDITSTLPNEAKVSVNFTDEEQNNHFGYSFFTSRDTINFWENLPISNDYI